MHECTHSIKKKGTPDLFPDPECRYSTPKNHCLLHAPFTSRRSALNTVRRYSGFRLILPPRLPTLRQWLLRRSSPVTAAGPRRIHTAFPTSRLTTMAIMPAPPVGVNPIKNEEGTDDDQGIRLRVGTKGDV